MTGYRGSKRSEDERNCSKLKVICKFSVSCEKNKSWLLLKKGKIYK